MKVHGAFGVLLLDLTASKGVEDLFGCLKVLVDCVYAEQRTSLQKLAAKRIHVDCSWFRV